MNLMLKILVNLKSIKYFINFVIKKGSSNHIQQIAGSLTFTTVLSIVPLVTVAFALFTAVPIFAQFQFLLQKFLADHLMPPQINNQIFFYINQFTDKAKGLTTIGIVGLCITSVLTMMTVESAFNIIWNINKQRPLAQRIISYWTMLTLGPILLGASLSISSYLFTKSFILSSVLKSSGILNFILTIVMISLTILAFTILYVYLPNCRVEWKDAVIGGIFSSILFEISKRIFEYYIRCIPSYTAVYGAFATIPIFLLWVYLSWYITLSGAIIASSLPEIRIKNSYQKKFKGSTFLNGLQILGCLSNARINGNLGCTIIELTHMLKSNIHTILKILQKLEKKQLIARIEKTLCETRFFLIANPDKIFIIELFNLFMIDKNEFEYRLNLSCSYINSTLLFSALENENLSSICISSIIIKKENYENFSFKEKKEIMCQKSKKLILYK